MKNPQPQGLGYRNNLGRIYNSYNVYIRERINLYENRMLKNE